MDPGVQETDHFVTLPDENDVRIHVREYAPGPGHGVHAVTLMVMHGLTRNHRDGRAFALTMAERGRRVLVWDTRGRGESTWGNPDRYSNAQYARDAMHVMRTLRVTAVCLVGTSMGGLIASHMAAECDWHGIQLRGCVLVDIAPRIEAPGLARIGGYIKPNPAGPPTTWVEAAERARATQQVAFPNRDEHFWDAWVRRGYDQQTDGRLVQRYDPALVSALGTVARTDYHALFARALAVFPHVLVLRGALSDILSAEGVAELTQLAGATRVECVVVPDVGHAPLLTEPESVDAIAQYIASI